MLKLKVYAKPQPAQRTRTGRIRRDGWNEPLQTIYLWRNSTQRYTGTEYDDIRDYQLEFYHDVLVAALAEPEWFKQRHWDQLPRIFNDPTCYTLTELASDTQHHYERRHDPCLSMLLRQAFLVETLSQDLGAEVKQQYGLDIEFRNPTEPVLAKFFNRIEPTNTYEQMFNTK